MKRRNRAKQVLAHRLFELVTESGLSESTLRAAIRSGQLKATKIGRAVVVADDEARRFLGCEPVAVGGGE